MRISDLPNENDRAAIVEFAQSFNGYEHSGSFEACATAARLQNRETLADLQNELFFSVRASNHRGDDDFLQTYQELLPFFKKILRGD